MLLTLGIKSVACTWGLNCVKIELPSYALTLNSYVGEHAMLEAHRLLLILKHASFSSFALDFLVLWIFSFLSKLVFDSKLPSLHVVFP